MSGPYSVRDLFEDISKPKICPDPENCQKFHNEPDPATDELHHYECECGWCQYVMWSLK